MKCSPILSGGAALPGGKNTVTLTVGTAGHIDHGKTSLVKLLTGCDCDTLPEEIAREMTIDLGFATCTLPNDRRVGIVDVPGHERFIHNMVAGASGIDAVILVVAANDGVMPQTVEHFHIVRLLGLKSGMVALTKTDLVAPERIEEVTASVRHLTAGSFLEGAEIVPVSSRTGEGFDRFHDVFVSLVDRTAERKSEGPFLMHVESAFVLKGRGTVVNGIPRSGAVHKGDELALLPEGRKVKVRGLHVCGDEADTGRAGECMALNLADIQREEAGRGTVLATSGYFSSARFVNAHLFLLPSLDRPVKPRTAVRLHVGTADVPGHLVLPTLDPMRAGMEAYVQIQLSRPIVAAPGDFFVVRQLSPVKTLGGGTIVSPETVKLRRGRGDWTEKIRERDDAFKDAESALTFVLAKSGSVPRPLAELSKEALVDKETAAERLRTMAGTGDVRELPGPRYVSREGYEKVREVVTAALNRLHDRTPLSLGFDKKDVYREVNADHDLVELVIASLLKEGAMAAGDCGYALAARLPRLSAAQAALAQTIAGLYRRTGFASPRPDELPPLAGAPAPVVEPLLKHLLQAGQLVTICDKVILHREVLELSRRKLVEYLQKNGTMESGVFKDVLGTTRKYSIPILEYWDAQGLTRRVGNQRVLRERKGTEGQRDKGTEG